MATQKRKAPTVGWATEEGGYEVTGSPQLIRNALARLKKKHVFIVLLHKGYQSGNTIVVNFNEQFLLIDKPMDWTTSHSRFRVVFKDEANVWNHFTVPVVGASKDTLKTKIPTELFRLQRRAHFRIEVPSGCRAQFTRKERVFRGAEVVNISAGGLMVCLKRREPIIGKASDASLQDLQIIIPGSGGVGGEEDNSILISVAKSEVKRESVDRDKGQLCLGIEFYPNAQEEHELFKYVRQRELIMLRKGIGQ